MTRRHLRIAVDIGGTFTDLAAFDEQSERLLFGKALSTHHALVEGIEHTAEVAGLSFEDATLFLHGSTIAINTLLERTGAKTALLVTEGFRDIYEIGRVNRPDAYNLFFSKHEPLTPRSLRFEVPERRLASGAVHRPLDEDAVRDIAEQLKVRGVEAIAIILLHAYRDPTHEVRVREIVNQVLPQAFVTASHTLSQEYREFERASTVAANAYIGPRVSAYVDELEQHLEKRKFSGDFFVVQSTGGLFPAQHARQECVRMLESGPAGGVIGAQAICAQMGLTDAIAFDMGGTTAKAGVIVNGRPLTTGSAMIGGYEKALPIQIPMMDIFEVGTGGGSLAQLGAGGALRVGPQSAGSFPGPACYGQGGTRPTVTDANLLLGRLDADQFLGGAMPLDVTAAEAALRREIAEPLNLDPIKAAEGILRIAVTTMALAVKGVTTARGLDAGRFTMVVYGGAGPLHASAIARELGVTTVIIPYSPGHFSAYGMLFSDLRHDYVRSIFRGLAAIAFNELAELYESMAQEGRAAIEDSSVACETIRFIRSADMRYVGQEHAVTVELSDAMFEGTDRESIRLAFNDEHQKLYGTCAPAQPVELVSVRMTALGVLRPPPINPLPEGRGGAPDAEAIRITKHVYFATTGFTPTPIYRRSALHAGDRISGPALIEELASTTVVQPGDSLQVNAFGSLVLSIGGDR